jgi:hypothetical protein
MTYELDKKSLKKINDYNQITKKIFKSYIIFENGLIISEDCNSSLSNGIHFAYSKIDWDFFNTDKKVMRIYTDVIFKCIKDNKKEIQNIVVENDLIYFHGEKLNIKFGEYLNELTEKQIELKQFTTNYINNISTYNIQQIDDKNVLSLCENNLETIIYDKFKLRLTQKVIPDLKNTYNMSLNCIDLNKDKLFETIFHINRDDIITTYHKYTCINF